MERTILGIDPGFGRMGFGCIRLRPGHTEVLDYGTITTPVGTEIGGRLLQIETDLLSLMDQHKPDLVAAEKLFFAKNVKTAMQVAEARGVLLLTCARKGIPVVEFAPAQIKLAVTGDGGADKRAIQEMVVRLLELRQTPKIDDAADALAVALTAAGMR